MKKIYFSMMALAIAAFTFTSCEDVPEPYNNPWNLIGGGDDTPVVVDPAGSGTAEDPYNVTVNETRKISSTNGRCKSMRL